MAKKPTYNDETSQAIRDALAAAPKNPKTGKPKKSADEIVKAAKNKGIARSRSKGVATAATTAAAQIPDEEAGTKVATVRMGEDGFPIAETHDVGTAINKTLGSQGIKDIRVPKAVKTSVKNLTPEGMGFSGVKEYPESGNADPLQSMQNLSVELAGHIARHRAAAPANYRGHFVALDRMVADADADLASATAAHNQGVITTGEKFRDHRPFRNSGYTNSIATLEPNHPTANMEPTNAVGYMTRAGQTHAYVAARLQALTEHLKGKNLSSAEPFDGKIMGRPANNSTDDIVKNYIVSQGKGTYDAPYRNEAGYSANDIGQKLASGRGAAKATPVEHYVTTDETGNVVKKVRRAKDTGGEAPDLRPSLNMNKIMGGNIVEPNSLKMPWSSGTYSTSHPIKNTLETDMPRDETFKKDFLNKVAARKAQDAAFETYKPNFVATYAKDNPEEYAKVKNGQLDWDKRQANKAKQTASTIRPNTQLVPDISDEAKTKFITGQVSKGYHPEVAEANWNKVVGYTKGRMQDFAYNSYASNIKATQDREASEAANGPASQEDAIRNARFNFRQSQIAKKQQESRPSAEATFGKIESVVNSIHSRATAQNANGSFVNPQAAKAAKLSMDALGKHKAGMWTDTDGPGLHAHLAKAISHIQNSATALAAHGDQHPDTLDVAHLGTLQGLHKNYVADWSNGRNPMILGGSKVKYDSVKADTTTKGKR